MREMSTYFRESAKTDETLTMHVHRKNTLMRITIFFFIFVEKIKGGKK